MADNVKAWIMRIIKSRIFILFVIIVVLFIILIQHLFAMQIIHGKEYLNDYTSTIQKTIAV